MRSRRVAISFCLLLTPALVAGVSIAAEPDGSCLIGQPWPGYDSDWIEPGTIAGDGETFYMLVDPGETCSCPVGFDITVTDVYLAYPMDTPLPVTITVSMGLAAAAADPDGPLPWLPGDTLCETPVRDFTFYIPKEFVGMGMALECDCAVMGPPYFLFFTIHSPMDPPGSFYTDGGGKPATDRFLTLVDGQWVDLAAVGILTRGGLVLDAFAHCCEEPVAVSDRRWSSIRSLYR